MSQVDIMRFFFICIFLLNTQGLLCKAYSRISTLRHIKKKKKIHIVLYMKISFFFCDVKKKKKQEPPELVTSNDQSITSFLQYKIQLLRICIYICIYILRHTHIYIHTHVSSNEVLHHM